MTNVHADIKGDVNDRESSPSSTEGEEKGILKESG